ncbi:MAG TPA: hypothetical protein DHU72_05245 [Rikenellaceae bacterium]|nr:hypothetical protein [Rikenellaceae bacterium]HCZ22816.1 hypothetical protein [Rikenellaceae bacterium]
MKIKDLCASERPRERLMAQGAESLSNSELLAILIKSGTRESSAIEVASALLKNCDGTLSRLFNSSLEHLLSVKGIGTDKACTIMSAFELGRRFVSESSGATQLPIVSSRTVYDIMSPLLKGLQHEECWGLFLDSGHRLRHKAMLSRGGISATVIDSRLVISRAIEKKSSAIILVHNHPGGDPQPSSADIKQTDALHKAASVCGISLLDHVIVCDSSFYSFSDDKKYRV